MALVANAAGGASAGSAPQLVVMDPIVVPIVGSDRLEGALRMKLVLEAADPAALARITKHLPELRAVTVAGAIEFSRLYASAQTPVDAVRLRAALTDLMHAKDHDVSDILIVEISAAA